MSPARSADRVACPDLLIEFVRELIGAENDQQLSPTIHSIANDTHGEPGRTLPAVLVPLLILVPLNPQLNQPVNQRGI